jgi:hypothetical protein
MKKIGLIKKLALTIALSVSIPVMSQNEPQYDIGIKAGLNLSRLGVKDVIDESTISGLNLGITFNRYLTKNFSVQPELLYSSKGSKLNFDNIDFHGTATFSLKYLDVPVLFNYHSNRHVNIHAGPVFSALLGTKITNANPKASVEEAFYDFESEISRDNFSALDFGFAVGVGIDYGIFLGGLRYSLGLVDIGREEMVFGIPYRFTGAANSLVQLYAGIRIFSR